MPTRKFRINEVHYQVDCIPAAIDKKKGPSYCFHVPY